MKKLIIVLIVILTQTNSQATVITQTVNASVPNPSSLDIYCLVGDTVIINVSNSIPQQKFMCPFGLQFIQAQTYGDYTFTFIVQGSDFNYQWAVYDASDDSHAKAYGTIYQLTTVGVEELSLMNVNVFPNPASNYIDFKPILEPTSIKLYDVTGKQFIETNTFPINTSELENGIYFIEIQSQNETIKKKIIVTK